MRFGRSTVASSAVVGVAVASTILIVSAAVHEAGKTPFNPLAGLTDQQKQSMVDQAHQRNIQFLNDFESRHKDPRTLPIIKIDTFQPPAQSLGQGAINATSIVHGHVDAVDFVADPSGGMPRAIATVTVVSVGKGSAGSRIYVFQQGGPVATPDGRGALVEFTDDQLLMPGDDALLLLTLPAGSTQYRPVYGPGVLTTQGAVLHGDSAKRYGVDGRGFQEVWSTLTDPHVSSASFPATGAGS